jgi:hypothetical protein
MLRCKGHSKSQVSMSTLYSDALGDALAFENATSASFHAALTVAKLHSGCSMEMATEETEKTG